MALVSNNMSPRLENGMVKNRVLSFREDLNDTRHQGEEDDFSLDEDEDEDDDGDEFSPSKDPDTAEIASMERRALKYRKSLTMLNQFSGLCLNKDSLAQDSKEPQPTKDHLLAAKKSIDDLTAWVNAGAFEGEEDPFAEED